MSHYYIVIGLVWTTDILATLFYGFLWFALNTYMRQYTAKDIEEFQNTYSDYITHIVVAHTIFRPYNKCQFQIDQMAEQAKKDMRHALNCFAKLLYQNSTNKPVRNPMLYRPLSFVTIENAKEHLSREQTIHFNIAFGNLPKAVLVDEIETLFKRAWVEMSHQANDVKVYDVKDKPIEASTWNGYSLKEAQQDKKQAWRFDGIWDVSNCWIPHAALNAD
jgi:hypothetical protein